MHGLCVARALLQLAGLVWGRVGWAPRSGSRTGEGGEERLSRRRAPRKPAAPGERAPGLAPHGDAARPEAGAAAAGGSRARGREPARPVRQPRARRARGGRHRRAGAPWVPLHVSLYRPDAHALPRGHCAFPCDRVAGRTGRAARRCAACWTVRCAGARRLRRPLIRSDRRWRELTRACARERALHLYSWTVSGTCCLLSVQ